MGVVQAGDHFVKGGSVSEPLSDKYDSETENSTITDKSRDLKNVMFRSPLVAIISMLSRASCVLR